MSRLIKMTPEYMDECRADFEKVLALSKFADGKLSFTKVFASENKKAIVYFTAAAWAKMALLIKEFSKEIAWHGVAHRMGEVEGETPIDDSAKEYVITDIVVYPQTVTAASVEMDTEEYAAWLMKNADDERFNHLFMQGHSHVNMATSPSSVDLAHQAEILDMLGNDDFYIFMIWNKSFSCNIKIYDMKENTLYESADTTVKLLDEDDSLDEFLKNAKDMVSDRSYPYQSTYNASAQMTTSPYNPLGSAKTHSAEKPRTRIGAGWYGKSGVYYDDEESPYYIR